MEEHVHEFTEASYYIPQGPRDMRPHTLHNNVLDSATILHGASLSRGLASCNLELPGLSNPQNLLKD